jgi:hypothetical protein
MINSVRGFPWGCALRVMTCERLRQYTTVILPVGARARTNGHFCDLRQVEFAN